MGRGRIMNSLRKANVGSLLALSASMSYEMEGRSKRSYDRNVTFS